MAIAKNGKIFVAGHNGLVGRGIVKRLRQQGNTNIVTASRDELDLTRQLEVEKFFNSQRPRYVFLAAGRVGGIKANISYPAQFIFENLSIQNNVIHASYACGVEKLLFFASACSYPCACRQPIKEEYLLLGPLEPTNEPYATAKIAGIKMCQAYNRQYGTNFISCVPTNIYGPGDNFDPDTSHVIPALIRKFFKAKAENKPHVEIWGTGKPVREFIYIDDIADGSIFLMNHYNGPEIINLCTQEGVTVKKLAFMIKEISGYKGKIVFDITKEDCMPRKVLDASRLKNLGWKAKIGLREGLARTCAWYSRQLNGESIRKVAQALV